MAVFLNTKESLTARFRGVSVQRIFMNGLLKARLPIITREPVNVTTTDDKQFSMSVVADGLGNTLTYQWYLDTGLGSGVLVGTNSPILTTSNGSVGTHKYYCIVTGFGGSVSTRLVTVTITASFAVAFSFTNGYTLSGSSNYYRGIHSSWSNYTTLVGVWPGGGALYRLSVSHTGAVAFEGTGGKRWTGTYGNEPVRIRIRIYGEEVSATTWEFNQTYTMYSASSQAMYNLLLKYPTGFVEVEITIP